ncbi:hypothetical protein FFK22_037605 [Mycobacterium sp. KBS0706]|uniref:hypothetical protein n=1 Tax=Mycobacterium sp. KBS0706 TaxID=2578109 RepID=UPI00110F6CAB|nr:hypothetical protein [Mycobacterium sp. KBS0706]TSD83476.1 hypothetical protein FFK22_037605 [Mycobacterium sp. KBS0706]
MTAILGPDHYLLIERLAFDLGRLDRELRGHPLAEAWDLRAMVLAGAAAAEDSGLTLDRGRLFAAAAELPIAVYRNDHGIPAALRHVQLQGAWFAAAAECGHDLERLLDTGPAAEAMGPWTERHFGWSTADLTDCIAALGRSEAGLAGLLRASWDWVAAAGDPMALTIAFPIAAWAQRFSARPLPGLFPRGRAVRAPARWMQLALTDLIGQVGDMTRRLQELERARLGLRQAIAGLRASSRLPAIAELALTRPAISSPTVVRHLTRLARRGGPLGRTTPAAIEARAKKEAVSAAGAGQMLRQLAATGWLVELTGSRSHRAYVARDLADLGIAMVPARLRPPPGHVAEEEPAVIPPLPSPGERKAPLEVDYTAVFSDLRMVECRIEALLSEMGLHRQGARANGVVTGS